MNWLCRRCTKAPCSSSSSSSCSCATFARPSSRRSPCRSRSFQPSGSWSTLGFSLNIVSLLAIILHRHSRRRRDRRDREHRAPHPDGQVALSGLTRAADEIGLAVIAISLTIVAVFIPASFMPSIPGQFFKQFGITVSVQVLFSLLCARMITPMLAAYFLKAHTQGEGRRARPRAYRASSSGRPASLHHVIIGLLVFAAFSGARNFSPRAFCRWRIFARSLLALELPPGSQLSDTEAVTDPIATRLRERPEVLSVFVDGGRISGRPRGRAQCGADDQFGSEIEALDLAAEARTVDRSDRRDVPDIRYWFIDENGQRNVTLIVSGQDDATVSNVAAELATQMRRLPFVTNVLSGAALTVRSSASTRAAIWLFAWASRPKACPKPSGSRPSATSGRRLQNSPPATVHSDARAARRKGARRPAGSRAAPRPVATRPGRAAVALADITFDASPVSISRYDRQRQARVEADLVAGSALSDAAKGIQALSVVKQLLPASPSRRAAMRSFRPSCSRVSVRPCATAS